MQLGTASRNHQFDPNIFSILLVTGLLVHINNFFELNSLSPDHHVFTCLTGCYVEQDVLHCVFVTKKSEKDGEK